MILTLDAGNSQIHGGVFKQDQLLFQFRTASRPSMTSDDLGIFLKGVVKENGLDPAEITRVSVCSVVPDLTHSIQNCTRKYFKRDPFFLEAGVKTGLNIKYRNPVEVGSDRIANAIAVQLLYPDRNAIIIDFGTATTFCVLTRNKDYLGGMILAGLRISMESLESRTAKLPKVEIRKPREIVGRTTVESIQSGLFYGQLAMTKEVVSEIRKNYFAGENVLVIGTGGLGRLFEKEKIFDAYIPDLVLRGLHRALEMNV